MSQDNLTEAILLYREALTLLPASHFHHQASLWKLQGILQCRFDLTRQETWMRQGSWMIGQIRDDDVTKMNNSGIGQSKFYLQTFSDMFVYFFSRICHFLFRASVHCGSRCSSILSCVLFIRTNGGSQYHDGVACTP